MPLPMVHLGVAYTVSEKLNITDLPAFYLGCIAPDGIYTREGFTREQKRKNHLIPEDRPRSIDDILEFYRKHRNGNEPDFVLGYTVHVLTDHLFNDTVYKEYLTRYYNDPAPVQDRTWAYYNDTDIDDFQLFESVPWKNEVWSILKKSHGVTIDGYITATEAEAWRDRTLIWYDSGESEHKNPVRYITVEDEINFITKAAEQICRITG